MSCIVYQLPSGRVVYLTVHQFLNMTEEDISYMDSNGFGTNANNPFRKLPYGEEELDSFNLDDEDDLDDDEDQSIDYNPADEDDEGYTGPIDYDQLF